MRGKSHFSNKKAEASHKERAKILKNHGQYPYILHKKSKQQEQLEYAEMAWSTSTNTGPEDPNNLKNPLINHMALQN